MVLWFYSFTVIGLRVLGFTFRLRAEREGSELGCIISG